MNKEEAIALWQDQLAGTLDSEQERELNEFLIEHPEVKAELADLEQTWMMMDHIDRPEPSSEMDARFFTMMAKYDSKESTAEFPLAGIIRWFLNGWQVGLASLIIGLLIGWWMLPSQQQSQDVKQLSSEIQDMKTMMMLTLIEQPKAQDRIQAVSLSTELKGTDKRVINALISTMNADDNLNVRLSALESLTGFGQESTVREALVKAILEQQSPIMQVAIADALVLIQAKNSVDELEKLKETIEDDLVKDHLEESIKTLKSI